MGVTIREDYIVRLEGSEAGLERIVFEDGSSLERKALFVRTTVSQHSDFAEQLGCEMQAMFGIPTITHNEQWETSVVGVYVAGDAGTMMQQVVQAAASGSLVGSFINRALSAENNFAAA